MSQIFCFVAFAAYSLSFAFNLVYFLGSIAFRWDSLGTLILVWFSSVKLVYLCFLAGLIGNISLFSASTGKMISFSLIL